MSQDDSSQPPKDAKDELFEAIEHFRNAASLLFERATKDPVVKTATEEAERVVRKIGEGAEPLARQLGGELSKLTRQVSDAINQNLGGRPKPPDDSE